MEGDDLFLSTDIDEWYEGGELSSAHDAASIKTFELPLSYVLFCYPRDYTPVCTKELIELGNNLKLFSDKKVVVLAASTDSPESHSKFFNDDEAFPPSKIENVEYPILTIKPHLLTERGRNLLINRYGYCNRAAVYVKDGHIVAVYQTDDNHNRSIQGVASLVV